MSGIEFHEGMPFDVEDITNAFIIIDDLMNTEPGNSYQSEEGYHPPSPDLGGFPPSFVCLSLNPLHKALFQKTQISTTSILSRSGRA
ncbi:hypothetical protein TNIN_219811 [Trichonephila inaurata madagascariensis]|uniref:Uncharacterized protein n=1 Tax=Trichonephila inaurata madagascariensis TaxID=2747483 RepID=A0A8X6XU27_9ARAC|nr:hypothetical protein TNIN_219811 [Trichonephila inaurata madagascariensis]